MCIYTHMYTHIIYLYGQKRESKSTDVSEYTAQRLIIAIMTVIKNTATGPRKRMCTLKLDSKLQQRRKQGASQSIATQMCFLNTSTHVS